MRTWSGVVRRAIPRRYADALGIERPSGRQDPILVDVDEVWREQRLTPQWTAAFRLVVHRGSLAIGECRVYPSERHPHRPPGEWTALAVGSRATCPRGGLTTSLMRAVRPADALRTAERVLRQLAADLRTRWPGIEHHAEAVPPLFTLPSARPSVPRRVPRVSDKELARFARAYKRAYRQAPHHPNTLLAQEFRRRRAWVRDRVALCRRRGFLPPAHGRGRASV